MCVICLVRFNGPNKMNTISAGMQEEAKIIFTDKILGNKDIKAVVFSSSKPDNFIAGADIDIVIISLKKKMNAKVNIC